MLAEPGPPVRRESETAPDDILVEPEVTPIVVGTIEDELVLGGPRVPELASPGKATGGAGGTYGSGSGVLLNFAGAEGDFFAMAGNGTAPGPKRGPG